MQLSAKTQRFWRFLVCAITGPSVIGGGAFDEARAIARPHWLLPVYRAGLVHGVSFAVMKGASSRPELLGLGAHQRLKLTVYLSVFCFSILTILIEIK
jgi:hypothetical protein